MATSSRQKAPQAPMNRRTTYQAAGARSTGRGSVVTTGGGGSTVTVNPGAGTIRGRASSSTTARPSSSSGGSSGRKGQRRIPGLPRGRSGGQSYANYQAVILAEFVAAELLVAATPIATRKNQPGLSPYVPRDLVKLMAIGLVYFILQLF